MEVLIARDGNYFHDPSFENVGIIKAFKKIGQVLPLVDDAYAVSAGEGSTPGIKEHIKWTAENRPFTPVDKLWDGKWVDKEGVWRQSHMFPKAQGK